MHEQNAIMGRANTFLSSRVTALATGFELVDSDLGGGIPVVVTGNPLRQVAHDAAKEIYRTSATNDPFKLLVFGGSQGARFFSEVLPEALALLAPHNLYRLRLTMQARPEDAGIVRGKFSSLDATAEVQEFFLDMPERIAASQLVICRSGASSVSELALIGRPSILVPLPGALDDDQGANAKQLEDAGGATLVRQRDLSRQRLADLLTTAMESPVELAKTAKNAKKAGKPDAAERLADLVEKYARA